MCKDVNGECRRNSISWAYATPTDRIRWTRICRCMHVCMCVSDRMERNVAQKQRRLSLPCTATACMRRWVERTTRKQSKHMNSMRDSTTVKNWMRTYVGCVCVSECVCTVWSLHHFAYTCRLSFNWGVRFLSSVLSIPFDPVSCTLFHTLVHISLCCCQCTAV